MCLLNDFEAFMDLFIMKIKRKSFFGNVFYKAMWKTRNIKGKASQVCAKKDNTFWL
jgi:hypothetical protein